MTVFPTLVSSNWKLTRTPQFLTSVQLSASGVRTAAAFRSKPLWKWTLKNGVLQSVDTIADLQAIETLVNGMQGMFGTFLWRDPDPSLVDDSSVMVSQNGINYWPVALIEDSADFERFAHQLWRLGKLEFGQVLSG